MRDRDLDERSRRLGDRVAALGQALSDAGVDPEVSARLLEVAATAALHALTLELLTAPAALPSARVPEPAPASAPETGDEKPVPVAA